MDTHTPQSARTHAIRQAFACCRAALLSILCPPTGHDPRHSFVSAPTARSLGNNYGPHLMTSGMPRAAVAVSSVIPLLFGLLSRNSNPREILTCSQLAGLACNYIPVRACTHTMHALRLSRPRAGFILTIDSYLAEIPYPHYSHPV